MKIVGGIVVDTIANPLDTSVPDHDPPPKPPYLTSGASDGEASTITARAPDGTEASNPPVVVPTCTKSKPVAYSTAEMAPASAASCDGDAAEAFS